MHVGIPSWKELELQFEYELVEENKIPRTVLLSPVPEHLRERLIAVHNAHTHALAA